MSTWAERNALTYAAKAPKRWGVKGGGRSKDPRMLQHRQLEAYGRRILAGETDWTRPLTEEDLRHR